MTDREMLELAAKAAGMGELVFMSEAGRYAVVWLPIGADCNEWAFWNPLEDDGDALRLAVKLKIDLSLWTWKDQVQAKTYIGAGRGIPLHGNYERPVNDHREFYDGDPEYATRRAITRAAAAIGSNL